eukprot:SAG22_NODE_5214_length_1060_cov_1.545265_1_plen_232_part_01
MGGRKARKRAQRRTRAGAGGAQGKGRTAATVESPRGNQRGRKPAQRDGDRATAGTARQVRELIEHIAVSWVKCEAEGQSNVNLPGDLLEKLVACDFAYTKQRIDEVPRCLLEELIAGAADDEREDGVSWIEERPVYARRDLVRIAKRLAKGARAATFEGAAGAEAMAGGETPIAVAVAVIRSVLARMGHDLSGIGLWSDDRVWMERQAMVEDTGLRDLASNIEEIIVACCAE